MSCLVVIVNYRTPELVVDCLASLEPELAAVPDVSVTVVDGHSGDDSVARIGDAIAENGWSWAAVTAAEKNGGFAYGNNVAIRPALASAEPPDCFWLLNPDTIVRPGALRALVSVLEEQPEVGVVGSRLEGQDGTAQTSAFRFFSILGELENGLKLGLATRLLEEWVVPRPLAERGGRVDWVSGASMLVRREVLDAVGLMDEEYFLFYEEVDLCLRARRAGWATWHEPASRVVHLGGQSTGIDESRPQRKPGFWFDSRAHYFAKNHGPLYALAADLSLAAGHGLFKLRMAIQRQPERVRPRLLRDLLGRRLRR
jgi:GT2 family glycosyltransferase